MLMYGLEARTLQGPKRRLAAHRDLNGNGFQLRQMIQIVAGNGFNEFAESHFPTLRMLEALGHRSRRNRAQQHQIPLTHTREGHHRGLRIVARVVACPPFLVEGLDGVMTFRQSLTEPIAEYYFAIREMAQDFKRAPFSRSRGFFNARWTERDGKLFKMPGGSGYYFERIASTELSCIGIHPITISLLGASSQLSEERLPKS